MGSADRLARLLVAAVLVILYYMNVISGTLVLVLIAVAGVFVLTSFVSFCPLYAPFGIKTCATKKE